jgi:hypothetical protein
MTRRKHRLASLHLDGDDAENVNAAPPPAMTTHQQIMCDLEKPVEAGYIAADFGTTHLDLPWQEDAAEEEARETYQAHIAQHQLCRAPGRVGPDGVEPDTCCADLVHIWTR